MEDIRAQATTSDSEEAQSFAPSIEREGTLASVLGAIIGVAAGLIGVGGGEFRIPVLINVLRFPIRLAAGANTVIGLLVVVVGVVRRWGQHAWTADDLVLAAVMAAASLPGAALGAVLVGKIPIRPLKRFVCAYLVAVGVWMLIEAFAHAEHTLLEPTGIIRWLLALSTGFLIAVISGALGVAGGEMRIPALLYLFAIPIKDAGTLSLLVSIPTVAAGAVTYRHQGHMPNSVLRIALLMGAGSTIGVFCGVVLLPLVDKHTIKGLLGAILMLATVRLAATDVRPHPET